MPLAGLHRERPGGDGAELGRAGRTAPPGSSRTAPAGVGARRSRAGWTRSPPGCGARCRRGARPRPGRGGPLGMGSSGCGLGALGAGQPSAEHGPMLRAARTGAVVTGRRRGLRRWWRPRPGRCRRIGRARGVQGPHPRIASTARSRPPPAWPAPARIRRPAAPAAPTRRRRGTTPPAPAPTAGTAATRMLRTSMPSASARTRGRASSRTPPARSTPRSTIATWSANRKYTPVSVVRSTEAHHDEDGHHHDGAHPGRPPHGRGRTTAPCHAVDARRGDGAGCRRRCGGLLELISGGRRSPAEEPSAGRGARCGHQRGHAGLRPLVLLRCPERPSVPRPGRGCCR